MQVLPNNLTEFLIRTYFKNHHLFLAVVLLRTALQFSHKSPGKFAVLLRTAVRFSPKTFFKNQPSVDISAIETMHHHCITGPSPSGIRRLWPPPLRPRALEGGRRRRRRIRTREDEEVRRQQVQNSQGRRMMG